MRYLVDQVSQALNAIVDERPRKRHALEQESKAVRERLSHLVTAVEAGNASSTVFQAIRAREAEMASLDAALADADVPLDDRLAVMPTWVRQQLDDVASLLAGSPERTKREFQRLNIRFTVSPVATEGPRPFLRAEGSGEFEHLAFSRFQDFTTSTALLLEWVP